MGNKKRSSKRYFNRADELKQKNLKRKTRSEILFEALLKLSNVHYLRQYIVNRFNGFYLLDFYLPDYNLCFEIDDPRHLDKISQDKSRDSYCLSEYFITTVRFKNEEVENSLPDVLVRMNAAIAEQSGKKEQIEEMIEKRVNARMLRESFQRTLD